MKILITLMIISSFMLISVSNVSAGWVVRGANIIAVNPGDSRVDQKNVFHVTYDNGTVGTNKCPTGPRGVVFEESRMGERVFNRVFEIATIALLSGNKVDIANNGKTDCITADGLVLLK